MTSGEQFTKRYSIHFVDGDIALLLPAIVIVLFQANLIWSLFENYASQFIHSNQDTTLTHHIGHTDHRNMKGPRRSLYNSLSVRNPILGLL